MQILLTLRFRQCARQAGFGKVYQFINRQGIEAHVTIHAARYQLPTIRCEFDPETQTQASLMTSSCADPTPETAVICEQQVQQILNVTVRIQLEYWSDGQPGEGDEQFKNEIEGAVSHATLVEGRYLITHNHFPVPLHALAEGQHLRLAIHKLNGEVILRGASTRKFDIVAQWSETLVLDFREAGEVLFRAFAVQSMPVATLMHIQVQPGMEVAQVNGDGTMTRVQWVQVQSVTHKEGVAQVVLSNGVRKGASGGGIFWQGNHIGNNWATHTVKSTLSGEIIQQFSTAAINLDTGLPG